MHSTLMVVVMETDTPMDILNSGMFWETLINTNLVAHFPSSGRSDSASLDGTFMDYLCSSLCWWS